MADRVSSLDDLLSEDDRQKLRSDLAEMARLRRAAEDSLADWLIP